MSAWTKRAIWAALAVGLVVLLVRAFRTQPVLVDVAVVERGPLLVTADDDGRTRVRERYTISAPIAGRLLRTALRPGDEVRQGDNLVAEFEPVAPTLLDVRAKREAEARIGRAEASLREAQARREEADAEHAYAVTEHARIRDLHDQGIQTREDLDRSERDEQRTFQGLRAAEFAVQVAEYEVEVARASLLEPSGGALEGVASDGNVGIGADGRLLLRSPVDGKVLRVFEESARTLTAGTPILEIGGSGALEIVADYLSQDAVKIEPGMEALVEGWGGEDAAGGERVLHGRVRVVEPGGFTKVSALGVEEQRVNVILDPVDDAPAWSALGDGYHVECRVILWRGEDVLTVPTGALFREGEAWFVYAVAGGHAERREVELGRMNGLVAQVLGGLAEGDRVVLYPSELIGNGTPLQPR